MNVKGELLTTLRKKNPLIHNLTNEVVTNFTANGLYALGASPVMSKAPEEAAEMASIADGVLINIGTLTANEVKAMKAAGKKANELNIPVVLDPVGVAATPYRKQVCMELLKDIHFTAIRGNAGEIATLIDQPWEARGVDSSDDGDVVALAQTATKQLNTLILLTGKMDVIAYKEETIVCHNGSPMLATITGSGCLLGSVLTAFLTLEGEVVDKATAAITTYTIASEQAVDKAEGPGSFHVYFLDALAAVDEQQIHQHARVEQGAKVR
ncbi:hydroxyethylthiazole kinase [Pontibacillus litoralis]|uniref:Hydroxyethylthiazole kinase n=1 Tax=Pontibacillus litoralis JSM 072002 TaxID=1385512 RepID=A0A0A5G7Y4_9BACI|nr:hydroxyethylthiazole kinase [Pontibacillus litoralis]KGX87215.1 hydroxyethylthiazole kinase [Pontibacillus litoralis JSM 072002]